MYLKVTGIMIIGAVLGLIGVITLLAGMSLLMGAERCRNGNGMMMIALIPAPVRCDISAGYRYYGYKNSDKPERLKYVSYSAITWHYSINTIIAITSPDMNVNVASQLQADNPNI